MKGAPKPSPAHDWRALAAERPQQRIPLDRPHRESPAEPITDPLTIHHGTDRYGRAFASVTGIGTDAVAHALDCRRWAAQLIRAAERMEGDA